MDWTKVKHFKPSEFECNCGCGRMNINPELVRKLDLARGVAKIPFRITSGCRCEAHNERSGGVNSSSHMRGYAVDIATPDSRSRAIIRKCLVLLGFTRFGTAKDFLHVDMDPDKPADVEWLYER